MQQRPTLHAQVEACVEETLQRLGNRIVLGAPLGLGKANHLINEFYRRASDDPRIDLQIFTALSLGRPRWKNDLERRFIEPLAERLFGGYPELAYVDPVKRGALPDNIRVTEFYFQPGGFLNSPLAQRHYVSSNYTHVVRDLLDAGINVVAQLVSRQDAEGGTQYSLSCNPDLTLDLVPLMRARAQGRETALLGQVNDQLPFMYGDAVVAPDYFDAVLDAPACQFPLFGVPNRPVSPEEYVLGLYVSALIPDGGTIQIGIGSLGHAVTYLLQMRHERNGQYRRLLADARVEARFGRVVDRLGGLGPFEQGLYASSEMLVDGFLELYRTGILKRRVYGHPAVQRLLNDGRIGEGVTRETLQALLEVGAIAERLTRSDVAWLQALGVLRQDLRYDDGMLELEDGTRLRADLADARAMEGIASRALGDRLRGGHVAHACFFLGPRRFYEGLRQLERPDREAICMTGISYVNELFGQEELKRLQRRHARFVNTGFLATLSGAVASDGLDDGRVISGVGGQYNFVAMAHALDDGRSILMIRSTRDEDGQVTSGIRWNYGHATIPRHLRDLVVTEYGMADLRGQSDERVATALIEIADARFQDGLLAEAKRAGKVAGDYRIPDHARDNRPERLKTILEPYRAEGLFDRFPFGTDLTDEELVLKKALTRLKATLKGQELSLPGPDDIRKVIAVPDSARPYLERLQLAEPADAKETLMQRAVVFALTAIDAI